MSEPENKDPEVPLAKVIDLQAYKNKLARRSGINPEPYDPFKEYDWWGFPILDPDFDWDE